MRSGLTFGHSNRIGPAEAEGVHAHDEGRRRTRGLDPGQGGVGSVSPQSALGREQGGTSARLSEERCRAFIEGIDEGVYEMDIDGHFVYFNDALCQVFGYPREAMQWQRFTRIMGQEQANAADEIFNEIHKTGSGISGLTWEIRGPGQSNADHRAVGKPDHQQGGGKDRVPGDCQSRNREAQGTDGPQGV